ncbi:TrmB family transcriptional regulator [Bacillus massiliigorillae]|uniref:TrmB family transcriptional regulator n=1 Tax=Bacillus massiliigorillae TaxID=1243664 RepID=UPI0003A53988|nr:helix-turn-helix domain-containing protein [Bacillus massiliigorillae]
MLKEFGFSQYESKVYETLVSSNQPMDVNMIAKHSSVPKAKIYEVLSRMIDKGMIMEAISEKKKMYTALSLEIAVERLTAEFQQNIEKFKEKTAKKTFSDDRVWSFKLQASIQAEMKKLIEEAKHSIRISGWSNGLLNYLPMLEAKEQQGIDVEVHAVGEIQANLTNLYYFIPTEKDVHLEPFYLIIVDDSELIFATSEDDSWQAIRTMSHPFVKFFEEFFYHDIVLTKILGKYKDTIKQDPEIMDFVVKLRY